MQEVQVEIVVMEHLQRKYHATGRIKHLNWMAVLDVHWVFVLPAFVPLLAGLRLRSYLEALAVACSGSERLDI